MGTKVTGNVRPTDSLPSVACCGEARDPKQVEFLCCSCLRWFHEKCMSPMQTGRFVSLMQNYTFYCQSCSGTGVDVLKKKLATFRQMCVTALSHLYVDHAKRGRTSFSVHKEIIPFLDNHWEAITTMPKRSKSNWHGTVVKTLQRDSHVFTQVSKEQFALIDNNVMAVCPPYDSNSSTDSHLAAAAAAAAGVSATSATAAPHSAAGWGGSKSGSGGGSSRGGGGGSSGGGGVKRKSVSSSAAADQAGAASGGGSSQGSGGTGNSTSQQHAAGAAVSKRSKSELASVKLPAQGFPTEYLHNKDDFHYILAEPDPHAPYRTQFEESASFLVTPGFLFRPILPQQVMLSVNDKAPQLTVHADRLSVTGHKGYSMCRCTHSVTRGSWYYELRVTGMPTDGAAAAARVGWARRYGNFQAPLGYDKFGYSWRSVKGTVFHESRGRHYMPDVSGFGSGDIIGCLIQLPGGPGPADNTNRPGGGPGRPILAPAHKDKALIKYKNFHYYEHKLNKTQKVQDDRRCRGSLIKFYKNGVSPGVAFTDIFEGDYFPAVSLYKNMTVKLNFGPKFECPPKDVSYQPMSDRLVEGSVEQALSEIVYFIVNEREMQRTAMTFL